MKNFKSEINRKSWISGGTLGLLIILAGGLLADQLANTLSSPIDNVSSHPPIWLVQRQVIRNLVDGLFGLIGITIGAYLFKKDKDFALPLLICSFVNLPKLIEGLDLLRQTSSLFNAEQAVIPYHSVEEYYSMTSYQVWLQIPFVIILILAVKWLRKNS